MSFFNLQRTCSKTAARRGSISTLHGAIETPVFMPVGTLGAVKGVLWKEMDEMQIPVCLANTYHLYLKPGLSVIREAGGLHRFANQKKPILTDSGGFQIFSLSKLAEISDEGYTFQSHIDGSAHLFTPESVIEYQKTLGSDIVMPLDVCTSWKTDNTEIIKDTKRTILWAHRSAEYFLNTQCDSRQNLFGIVQGSGSRESRLMCCRELSAMPFSGYAIGGLSVGETKKDLYEMTKYCCQNLPVDKPRYLMGVGAPEDIVECIRCGIDMFDCVLPTRNGRNATVYTYNGKILLRNSEYQKDFSPIDNTCNCYTCSNYSRSYLRHLFNCKEMNASILSSIHNLFFLIGLCPISERQLSRMYFLIFTVIS